MEKIKIGIIGIGNCASSLIQGIEYYKNKTPEDNTGLMHWDIGGYLPGDIEVVLAIDIDQRKVGHDLSEAIFSPPNCTTIFCKNIPKYDLKVQMGHVLDGVSSHMDKYEETQKFIISDETPQDTTQLIKDSGAEIIINYLPVGSEKAVRYYAQCCLDAKVAFINNMPVFIASDPKWAEKFQEKNLPIIGDDIKAQVGATITHRTLTQLFQNRGVQLDKTYQLNTGGNTDFLNMLNRDRLESKKTSKTEAVQSILNKKLEPENIHIGPSDYVPWQKDNKICYLRMEGRLFGDVPMNLELRLSVEDSPNSAACVIDAIRCCKLALNNNLSGPLKEVSAYLMKHPPQQYPDNQAHTLINQFIQQNTL